ncbi:MAG: hypothetical protein WCO09_04800 [bacterium]
MNISSTLIDNLTSYYKKMNDNRLSELEKVKEILEELQKGYKKLQEELKDSQQKLKQENCTHLIKYFEVVLH